MITGSSEVVFGFSFVLGFGFGLGLEDDARDGPDGDLIESKALGWDLCLGLGAVEKAGVLLLGAIVDKRVGSG